MNFNRIKTFLASLALGAMTLVSHAQLAQDPLLSRLSAVPPNVVFMFDDSASMVANFIYQYGGTAGVFGMSGPTPTTYSAVSPDVNLMYYDPRVTYSRRVNADGSFMAAGSVSAISSFPVYFYKPATATTYKIQSVAVTNGGSGYASSGVTGLFTAAPVGGTTAIGTVTTSPSVKVSSVTVNTLGSGYPASGKTVTFSAPPAGGVTATGTVSVGSALAVSSVTTTAKGSGYPASGVTAAFSAPPAGGTTAVGTVTLGSSPTVGAVTVVSKGGGYPASGVTATFSAPAAGGVQATGTPVITSSLKVSSVTVNTQGNGYAAGGSVLATFSAPAPGGVQATALVTISGSSPNRKVNAINIINPGSGYTTAPTITLSGTGGGTGATFTVNMAATNVVSGITVTNPGAGYTTTPTVTLGGVGAGTGASFTVATGTTNVISGIVVTNAGAGYTAAPTISLAGTGTGSGAAFTVNTSTTNVITGINVTNGGAGYTTPPTLTLGGTAGGSGATFTVNAGTTYVVSAVSITNPGSKYNATPVPTLTLSGTGGGTGATFAVSTVAEPAPASLNQKWNGTGSATLLADYFTPSYAPLAAQLAAGADTTRLYPNSVTAAAGPFPLFLGRTDCGSTNCSWAQEQQNYANWKTYHSTRLDLAKTGIGLAFQPLNPVFRLGWGTINTIAASSPSLDSGVQLYNSTVQSNFLSWLYARNGNVGATPNRKALANVGTYFTRADAAGPWGASPTGSGSLTATGGVDSTAASCRKSYAMLMTDGYYNESSFTQADVDSTSKTVTTQPNTFVYSGDLGPYSDTLVGTKFSNTFADVAMKYWSTDLRPDIDNNVVLGTGSNSDPAYWQHLNFFAIGLGVVGTLDADNPATLQALTGSSSTTPVRTLDWPSPTGNDQTAIDDMWHATINGRGKMLNAKTAGDLNTSITALMAAVNGTPNSQAGVAVSTANLQSGTKKYTATYTPVNWNGNVIANNLDPVTGNETTKAWQVETPVIDAVTKLTSYNSLIPSAASRNIFVGNGATSGVRAIPFQYSNMSSAGLTASMTGTVNAALINYLRGDPTNEDVSSSGISSTAIYRGRQTRLGDIVNSTPVLVKNSLDMSYEKLPSGTPGQSTYRAFVDGTAGVGGKKQRAEGVLFVGANDGMLHAFRDGTKDASGNVVNAGGIETFAYVPMALLPSLSKLADKAYLHQYYVDGPIVEADAYFGASLGWANLVVGSTGGGAGAPSTPGTSPRTAVFALDVTSLNSGPTTLNASKVLWEIGSGYSGFTELGYVLTDVQTGTTPDGQWVAIFGNGYESASCQARLFVVNLQTGAKIREINTGAGSCGGAKNGLGGVRLVRNANQQIIGAYAGDLLGNLWKFNLNNTNPASWGVDLGGSPLYTAGAGKPITAPPSVITLSATSTPTTGYMVIAGTGKFFETADISSGGTQSMYGIWDPVQFGAAVPAGTALTNSSLLVTQTISVTSTVVGGNTFYTSSALPVDFVGSTSPLVAPRRGWTVDLPNTGERMVYPMNLLANRVILFKSISPSNVSLDPCVTSGTGTGFSYVLDGLSGGSLTIPAFDVNGDGAIDSADLLVSGYKTTADGRDVTLQVSNTPASLKVVIANSGSTTRLLELRCPYNGQPCSTPTSSGRVKSRQWRQLFMR
jgi:type IV pilus assembly protein PilY1